MKKTSTKHIAERNAEGKNSPLAKSPKVRVQQNAEVQPDVPSQKRGKRAQRN